MSRFVEVLKVAIYSTADLIFVSKSFSSEPFFEVRGHSGLNRASVEGEEVIRTSIP